MGDLGGLLGEGKYKSVRERAVLYFAFVDNCKRAANKAGVLWCCGSRIIKEEIQQQTSTPHRVSSRHGPHAPANDFLWYAIS